LVWDYIGETMQSHINIQTNNLKLDSMYAMHNVVCGSDETAKLVALLNKAKNTERGLFNVKSGGNPCRAGNVSHQLPTQCSGWEVYDFGMRLVHNGVTYQNCCAILVIIKMCELQGIRLSDQVLNEAIQDSKGRGMRTGQIARFVQNINQSNPSGLQLNVAIIGKCCPGG